MGEFITILNDENSEITEKKSKFIANISYVENVDQAEEVIKKIKKKYHDARHNCIAYRIMVDGKILEKASDDGEPSGTAGSPMLTILQKSNLCNVVVVVTRYFGGILLGTGGLVRAYTEATQKVIEKCIFAKKIEGLIFQVRLEYMNLESFKYYCKNNEINIINIQYNEEIILNIEVEKSRKDIFLNDINEKKLIIKEYQVLQETYINKTVEENK